MRISDWSSDVCSSDLTETGAPPARPAFFKAGIRHILIGLAVCGILRRIGVDGGEQHGVEQPVPPFPPYFPRLIGHARVCEVLEQASHQFGPLEGAQLTDAIAFGAAAFLRNTQNPLPAAALKESPVEAPCAVAFACPPGML